MCLEKPSECAWGDLVCVPGETKWVYLGKQSECAWRDLVNVPGET